MEADTESLTGKIVASDFWKYQVKSYRMTGFEFQARQLTTIKEKVVGFVKSFYFYSAVINIAVSVLLMAVFIIKNLGDLLKITRVLPNVTNVPLVLLKTFTVCRNKELIKKMFMELEECFPTAASDQARWQVETYLRNFRRFANCYAFFLITLYISLVFKGMSEFYSSGKPSLPGDIWLPFDLDNIVIFTAVYFWILWLSWNTVLLSFCSDLTLNSLVTLIGMEYDILSKKFENLKDVKPSEKSETVKKLLDQHNKLNSFSDQLEKLFSFSFLYNFTQSSLVICFAAFQLSTVSEPSIMMLFGSYLVAILLQILLLCHFGQKLKTSSLNVSVGVYNCGWEEIQDLKLRRKIHFILMRSHKPAKLTAKKFRVISFESFTSVRERKTF